MKTVACAVVALLLGFVLACGLQVLQGDTAAEGAKVWIGQLTKSIPHAIGVSFLLWCVGMLGLLTLVKLGEGARKLLGLS